MRLDEIMKRDTLPFILQALRKMREDGLFTRNPQKWSDIRAIKITDLTKKYGCTPEGMKANIKRFKLQDIWDPDLQQTDPKLRFSYPPIHKFNKHMPVIFLLDGPGGLYLVDTGGGDRIEGAIKLVK